MIIKKHVLVVLFFIVSTGLFSQFSITGNIIDETNQPVPNILVILDASDKTTTSSQEGNFTFENVTPGTYTIIISSGDFEAYSQIIDVSANENIGPISLKKVNDKAVLIDGVDLDLELDDGSAGGSISYLQSSVNNFRKAAAFQWGSFFFRTRGYDNDKQEILFNGIKMNKAQDNRPLFRDWGGLNDVTRYPEESTVGLDPSIYTLGSLNGVTSFSTRASNFPKGGRVSAALTNYSYTQRIMGMYSSGMQPNGWAYTVSGSRRWAEEGVQDGTKYDSWSYFVAVEKKLSPSQSINFTTFGSPYKRAGSAPNTQEAYDLNNGIHYNSYWGYQDGEKRNERIRRSFQPIYMLTHYWKINDKSNLETTLSYQTGRSGYTRLGEGQGYYVGGTFNNGYDFTNDASPTYYRYLPSYDGASDISYNNTDPYAAPVINGQINWFYLYLKNKENADQGKSAAHFLIEDVTKDKIYNAATHLKTQLNNHITLNSQLAYQYLESRNYREMYDLLGGLPISNYDYFNSFDYNLLDNNELINEGDTFDYSYTLNQHKGNAYGLLNFTYNKVDFYLAGDATYTQFWREGNYQYEAAKLDSYGVSKKESFFDYGLKGGLTYKLNGSNFLTTNVAYKTVAPTINEAFPAVRYLNYIANELTSAKILSSDINYSHNGKKWKGTATLYYTATKDDIQNQAFYDSDGQNIFGTDDDGFIYSTLSNVETKNAGIELGLEYLITTSLKLHGAASLGQAIFTNNPTMNALFISNITNPISRNNVSEVTYNNLYYKDYKQSNGPQTAYNIGIEYNSPKHWWIGLDWNLLSDNYVSITPIKHSGIFTLNETGSQERVNELLRQERFSTEYFLNFNAGKSIRIGQRNVLASLNIVNILNNEDIKTGGFEQGRTSTYSSANTQYEKQLNGQTPAFGNRYWYQQGMQFFFNVTYKF